MEYSILGRTGLEVSVIGLGAGGHSRLGLSRGGSESDALAVVRRALEMGVNLIDTSEAYGTEEIVGRAVAEHGRDRVVISTKKKPKKTPKRPSKTGGGELVSGEEALAGLDVSLRRLGTDRVEIYHVHGVRPHLYGHVASEIAPALMKARDAGKVRAIGITEFFSRDTRHETLARALAGPLGDDCWDVVMVGFNILNQTARDIVLPAAREKGVGVLCMFAVREALSKPERLRETVADLEARGMLAPDALDAADPLGFLVREGGATSVVDAGYRFCRYERGIHSVLSGTGSVEHLAANVESLLRPPLPGEDVEKLRSVFAGVDDVSGE